MKIYRTAVFVPAIFILFLLAVIAAPSFFRARTESRRNACLNNLSQLICPMTCCVPLAHKLAQGDRMEPWIVAAYIKGNTIPTCPSGATYDIAWIVGGPTPKCPIHGDLILEVMGAKNLLEAEKKQHEAREAQQKAREATSDSAPSAESEASQP